jgi:hypothetical protein
MRRGLGVLLVGMLRLSVAEWDEREELRGHPGGMVQEEEAPGDEGETFWEGGWEGDVQEDGFSDGDLRNVLDWLSRSQQSQPFIVVQVRSPASHKPDEKGFGRGWFDCPVCDAGGRPRGQRPCVQPGHRAPVGWRAGGARADGTIP